MKCPKCGYLGFDHADRCRNCGYDFSLAVAVAAPELPLRAEPQVDGLPDLALAAPHAEPDLTAELDRDLDRILSAPSTASELPTFPPERPAAAPSQPARGRTPAPASVPAPSPTPAAPEPPAAPADALPLFGGPITDDVPLITKASPPRAPLAVRRATPEVPRLRPESPRPTSAEPRLDLDVPEAPVSSIGPSARARHLAWPEPAAEVDGDAAIGARLVAVAIDLLVLAAIDAIVIYFTLQICGLKASELGILPKGPLLAFLAVQNGGYLVAFTAGGQTLGKMATGIKVVAAGSGASIDVGRAALRTLMWIVLAVPAGLGFLSVLAGDRRGFHDRFAGTRVVRASA